TAPPSYKRPAPTPNIEALEPSVGSKASMFGVEEAAREGAGQHAVPLGHDAVDDGGPVAAGVAPEADATAGDVVDEMVGQPFELVEVEHREVGTCPGHQRAPVAQAHQRGGPAGEVSDTVLERQITAVAHMAGEQQRGV